jgi:hypothetical protein
MVLEESMDRTHRSVRMFAFMIVLVVAVSCDRDSGSRTRAEDERSAVTPRCEDVIPECHMERLQDIVLTGDQHDGALGPIEDVPEGVIGFDEALRRAWAEDGRGDAKAVQVVLGSADAAKLHWGQGDLFYGVKWSGVCLRPLGPRPTSNPCIDQDWGTVIDAWTGAFIVGGTGP